MHACADLFDRTCTFVPQDCREVIVATVTRVNVVIAVANPGPTDLDHHFTRTGIVEFKCFNDGWLPLFVNDRGERRGGHDGDAPFDSRNEIDLL